MKKIFVLCLSCCLISTLPAQVRIGGAPITAHPSSILELDGGNNRGLLLPRMRKLDMLAIVDPAEGLTVYVTDEQATYLRRQNDWIRLSGNDDVFSLPYTGSFGTTFPILSLTQTNNSTGSVLKLHMSNAQSEATALDVTSNASGYNIHTLNAGNFRMLNVDNTGSAIRAENSSQNNNSWAVKAIASGEGSQAGYFSITNSGNLNSALYARTDGTGNAITAYAANGGHGIEAISNSYAAAIFGWKNIFQTGRVAQFTNLNPDNSAPILELRQNGTGHALAITGETANPQIMFQQWSDPHRIDKGFIQLNGNDLRMGTVAANSTGNLVFRTGGLDRFKLDSDGQIGIGDDPVSTAAVNIASSNGSGEANLELRSAHSATYGPSIRFYGTSPTTGTLGNIQMTTSNMEFRSGFTTSKGYKFFVEGEEAFRIGTSRNAAFGERLAIGHFSPATLLHVDGYRGGVNSVEGEIARFQGFNPTIQITNIENNIGFIQAAGSAIRMGTNAGNTGEFIIRMNGTNRVYVDNLGNMSIGPDMYDAPPSNDYKLAVKGKIAGTEFVVRSTATWPDYVFEPGYKMMSLSETEAYIKQHKHLPNIQPATEIEKNGIPLGDMQKRMMEKIEELTLHLIEADKQIKELKAEVKTLKEK